MTLIDLNLTTFLMKIKLSKNFPTYHLRLSNTVDYSKTLIFLKSALFLSLNLALLGQRNQAAPLGFTYRIILSKTALYISASQRSVFRAELRA